MAKDRNVPLGIGLLGGNAKVYNTIAEMQKDSKLKAGKVVEVLGYYQAGDGAGHKRVIVDSDDGSGVQLENGLYANIIHNGEVNVKWLGAIPNNDNDAQNNHRVICNAFINGLKLYIDDVFYLKRHSQDYKQNFNKLFYIRGNGNAELIITEDFENSYLFYTEENLECIYIDNIKYTNISTVRSDFLAINGMVYIPYITVKNCNINFNRNYGAFILWITYSYTDYTPVFEKTGSLEITISNNKIYNTKYIVFSLQNIIYKKCIISNNYIKNMNYIFIDLGTTNEFVNAVSISREYKLITEISGNICVNDKDYVFNDEKFKGNYLSVVIVECRDLIVRDNYTEGLVSAEGFEAYVFDYYCSAKTFHYINNVWRNNISGYNDKMVPTPFKNKTCEESYIFDNTFVLEKQFVEDVGINMENAYIGIIQCTHPESHIRTIFKNNYFNVFAFKETDYSNYSLRELEFSDNTVIATEYSSGAFLMLSHLTHELDSIRIFNNRFEFNGCRANFTFLNDTIFYTERKFKEIKIKNNDIKFSSANNKNTVIFVRHTLNGEYVDISDNTIVSENSKFLLPIYRNTNTVPDNFIFDNKYYFNNSTEENYLFNTSCDGEQKSYNLELLRKGNLKYINTLTHDITQNGATNHLLEIEYTKNSKKYYLSYGYKLIKDDSGTKITYTNSLGNETTETVNVSGRINIYAYDKSDTLSDNYIQIYLYSPQNLFILKDIINYDNCIIKYKYTKE